MNLSAAALKLLADKGLTLADIVELVEANDAAEKPRSAAAKRQARYRQRRLEGVTNDVTSDVTPPPKDNSNPLSSVSNETGGEATDPVKLVFDLGVSLLVGSGQTEKQARSLIGKYRKSKSDAEVLAALMDCRRLAITNPVEWLEKRFKGSKYVSKSGYEYRGDIHAVIREAERRNDMDTYWTAKSDLRQQRQAA